MVQVKQRSESDYPPLNRLYKTLMLSILLYGYEAWTITEKMKNKIKYFENKVHRRLLGINYRAQHEYLH